MNHGRSPYHSYQVVSVPGAVPSFSRMHSSTESSHQPREVVVTTLILPGNLGQVRFRTLPRVTELVRGHQCPSLHLGSRPALPLCTFRVFFGLSVPKRNIWSGPSAHLAGTGARGMTRWGPRALRFLLGEARAAAWRPCTGSDEFTLCRWGLSGSCIVQTGINTVTWASNDSRCLELWGLALRGVWALAD